MKNRAYYYKEMKNYDIQIDFIVNKKIEPCYLDIIDENKSNIYILDRNRNPMKYMLQLYFIIKKNSRSFSPAVYVFGLQKTFSAPH